jgi:hypothetical protein
MSLLSLRCKMLPNPTLQPTRPERLNAKLLCGFHPGHFKTAFSALPSSVPRPPWPLR